MRTIESDSMFLIYPGLSIDLDALLHDPRLVPPIETIAHCLSMINRYAGSTCWSYTVAQHSVLLSHMCPPQLVRHALLHDAAEMFIGDIPSPVKKRFPELKRLEGQLLQVIFQAFELPVEGLVPLKGFEDNLFRQEIQSLLSGNPESHISPLSPDQARILFLERWTEEVSR